MRENNTRIFSNKDTLKEMLSLYKSGSCLSELAKRYNCDHTSILYQVKKHGFYKKYIQKALQGIGLDNLSKAEIEIKEIVIPSKIVKQFIPKNKIDYKQFKKDILKSEEKVAMNYEDYLLEEERARLRKISNCEHKIWTKRCSCCGKFLENEQGIL